jgi:hypothetical protein
VLVDDLDRVAAEQSGQTETAASRPRREEEA